LVAHLDGLPEHAMVVPQLTDADGHVRQSAFLFPSIPVALMFAVGAHHLLPQSRRQRLLLPGYWGASPQDVPWAIGAVMLVRRSAIERVGLLDESFFVYGEDMEWCQRMGSAGMRIRFTPRAPRTSALAWGSDDVRMILAVIRARTLWCAHGSTRQGEARGDVGARVVDVPGVV